MEGFEGRQLGHLLPGPGGYDPEGRQDQVRADLHLVPRVSGARQHQPSRCQAGCRRQPPVGVALRHDPRRSAEPESLRRVEQGQDHGLQRHGRTRPERQERRGVPPVDSPVDRDAGEQQVQLREVAPGVRVAEQLRR